MYQTRKVMLTNFLVDCERLAFSVFWGIVPGGRGGGSLESVAAYLRKVREDGTKIQT